nr:META domain-containing protein [uncultured Flavobacterium sp.]
MKKWNVLLIFLVLATALFSCKSFKEKDVVTTLENTNWQLIKTQKKVYSKTEEQQNVIMLSFANGNFNTSDGCNSIGGGFTTEGSAIEFDKIRATMRYCDQEFMEKHGYSIPFHEVKKFEIKKNKLYLFEDDGKTLVDKYEKK